MLNKVVPIGSLIGKIVLSKATGDTLGRVDDLCIDPIGGRLVGLMIQESSGQIAGLDCRDVYSFGEDAIMANSEDSIFDLDESCEAGHAQAKEDLIGIKIYTENGDILGEVANVFIRLIPPFLVFYEVRRSILDKLLGNNFFILASVGRALSSKVERIIVPSDTKANAAARLQNLITAENESLHNDTDVPKTQDETIDE